ncbi:hypothetical protein LSH36_63g04057 [Paralvinella palmiformis]|uniref:C2H2-type domain-containing protein n=1 Tax=Paralvinella palmiformis TaxID=53620 RepID=A0AAD9K417_9ANNE|nr:hypothetical protein LSH36_63g04057 [Paralvinella palmiformis]
MVLQQPERDRIRSMIKDTITLLCRNSLSFKSKFSIEAVIGVTLDDDEVFLVSMNEIIESDRTKDDSSQDCSSEDEPVADSHKRCRKRTRVKREGRVATPDTDESSRDMHVSGTAADVSSLVRGHSREGHQERVKIESENMEDDSNDIMFVKEEISDSWLQETLPDNNSMDNNAFRDFATGQSQDCDPSNRMSSITGSNRWDGDSMITSVSSSNKSHYVQQQRRMLLATSASEQQSSHMIDKQVNSSGDVVAVSQETSPFTCTICGKVCSNKSNLRRHERAHYGIYPYRCSLCDKGFFSQDNLKAHLYIHTGVAQFRCELCDQTFRYKEVLRQHIHTHGNRQEMPS